MSKPSRKLRSSAKSYPAHVRWAIDYSPEYLKKLRETDPAAYEYLLKFLEAEYGGNSKTMGLKKKERQRCDAQVYRMKEDVMGRALHGIDPDTVLPVRNPEDALNALIDNRHIISAIELEKPAKRKRRIKKASE